MTDSNIITLAKDYDMEVWEVKEIVKKHPSHYHDYLEDFIKERANR